MADRISAVERFIRVVLGLNGQLDKMPEDPNHPLWFQVLKARLVDVKACEEWLIWRQLADVRFLLGSPKDDPAHDHHGMREEEPVVLSGFVHEFQLQGFYHLVPERTTIEGQEGNLQFWGHSRDGDLRHGSITFRVEARDGVEYHVATALDNRSVTPELIFSKTGVTAEEMFLAIGEDMKWVQKRRQELLEQTAAIADAMAAENALLMGGNGVMRLTEYDSIRALTESLAAQYGLSLPEVEIREDQTVPKLNHPGACQERQTGHSMQSADNHTIVQFLTERLEAHCPTKYRAWVYEEGSYVPI